MGWWEIIQSQILMVGHVKVLSVYDHAAKNCKRKNACLKCGGQHILRDCKSERSECVNCKNVVNKLQLKIDVNHPAWSKECATYRNKIDI